MAKGRLTGTQLHFRTFIQMGDPVPASGAPQYLAQGDGQLRSGGFGKPIAAKNTVYRPSDDSYGSFQAIGTTGSTPPDGTISLTQDYKPDKIQALAEVATRNRPVTLHLLSGEGQISDSNNWTSKFVFPSIDISSWALGDVQSDDADELVQITSEFTFTDVHQALSSLRWSEKAASTVATPVAGVAFGENDWYQYAVVKGDGSSTSPKFLYSHDRGATWTSVTLSDLGNAEHPNDLIYVGGYLIAPHEADGYIWASAAAPGTWAISDGGFVASKTPNAAYAKSLARVYFACDGGYIMRGSSVGTTVSALESGGTSTENLYDIDGVGDVVVAVGGANVVLYSANDGASFSLVTGPSVGNDLLVVQVLSEDDWIIGDDAGDIFYTHDAGSTWSTGSFPGSGAGSITGLAFYKNNTAFGVLCHKNATPNGKVYRTTDGGVTWEQTTLTGYPTCVQVDACALYDPNTFLAGGVATGGTDGNLAVALPSTKFNTAE